MYRIRLSMLLIGTGLTLIVANGGAAATRNARSRTRLQSKRPQVVVVVVDAVSLADYLDTLDHLPTCNRLMQRGAIGLMVTRTARDQSPESTYLSIGCGARATTPLIKDKTKDNLNLAFGADERYLEQSGRQLYQADTGRKMGSAALAQCRIAQMQRENLQSDYQAMPGRFGALLAHAGARVTCIGNADSKQFLHRPAINIAMDDRGLVPMGEVGASVYQPAPELPSGIATDFKKLQQAVDRYLDRADFIVIETGDTARIAEYADQVSDAQAAAQRHAALRRIDRFLGWLLRRIKGKLVSLFIITPTSLTTEENPTYTLSSIIAYGHGIKPGLLTSPSTRQPGMVVNTDLAPTWLAQFGLPRPVDLTGRPMTVGKADHSAVKALSCLQQRLAKVEQQRLPATRTAIGVMMLTMGLATLLMMLGERAPAWLRSMLRWLLPIIILVPPLVDLRIWLPTAVVIVVMAVALRSRLFWLMSLLMLALTCDLFSGGRLLSSTLLSYSPASGARYYGIGNELGGVFVAITLITLLGWKQSGSLISRRALILLALAFMVALALMGLPFFGANFGIMLGSAVGLAAGFARLCGTHLTVKTVGVVFLIALIVVGSVVAVDLLRGAGSTHIGRAFGSGAAHQGSLWVIAGRKLATNWRVFQVSLWSRLLGLAVACLLAAVVWLPPAVKAAYERHRNLGAIMTGIGRGSAALFLLNDSGVVAAALTLTLGATWLTWCALELPRQETVSITRG